MLALRVRWSKQGRVRERDGIPSCLDPSPFTEGLYEARLQPVSTLKLQIPSRFVDRMAVSYSCNEKLHSASVDACTQAHAHTHIHTNLHAHTHSCTLSTY